MRCRGVQEVANPPYLKGFPFPALLSVAPYCVPGGIRVVSSRVGSRQITRRRFLCQQTPFEYVLSSVEMRVDMRAGRRRPGKFNLHYVHELHYAGIIHVVRCRSVARTSAAPR
jgi:hypothetical protein